MSSPETESLEAFLADVFSPPGGNRTPPPDDPYQTVEYQRFVEDMAKHCRCTPYADRPCDGVLAGGPCDDAHRDLEMDSMDDELERRDDEDFQGQQTTK
jgi:hypothetical protein